MLADGQEREVVFTLGSGRDLARGPRPGRTVSAEPGRARTRLESVWALLEPHAGRGPRGDARPVAQLPRQRLAALPDARLPRVGAQRLLPVRRRLRLPRSAAGRDGAGPRRAGACCASTCSAARRASSAKATCSTGGIRRRAAACARASPTITCGCRCAACRYVHATGDTGVLDETRPLPRRPRREAGRGELLRPAGPLRRIGDALRALRPRDRARPALRRARPAADGLRRLERRHEPASASTAGARASGWPSSCTTCSRSSPTLAERAATTRSRSAA